MITAQSDQDQLDLQSAASPERAWRRPRLHATPYHVGITVAVLDTVTAFFVGLGLEVEGRTFVDGEFVDTVIGIPASRSHSAIPMATEKRRHSAMIP